MAARDYEDLLQVMTPSARCLQRLANLFIQCAIPVFDGLLPEPHNSRVLELLFSMAQWHGLAKLRLHTDLMLDILDMLMTTLGEQLCNFSKKTCALTSVCALDIWKTVNITKAHQIGPKANKRAQTRTCNPPFTFLFPPASPTSRFCSYDCAHCQLHKRNTFSIYQGTFPTYSSATPNHSEPSPSIAAPYQVSTTSPALI